MRLPFVGIALGIVAIVLGLAGLGLANSWGVAQFGAISTWIFGIVTLAALLLAFAESRRSARESRAAEARTERQRQIDHEIERRRETSRAMAELWSGIAAEALAAQELLNFFDQLPLELNLERQRNADVTIALGEEILEVIRQFLDRWLRTVEGPLLYALIVSKGTKLDEPTRQLNKDIRSFLEGALPELARFCFEEKHKPEVAPIEAHWKSITKRRQDFLDVMRDELALDWESVNRAVIEQAVPSVQPE